MTALARLSSKPGLALAISVFAALTSASHLHAQEASGDSSPAATAAPTAPEAGKGEGTPAVVLDDHGVESLLGKEVTGAAGEKLGRIVDVLVAKDGTLRAAVIDFGGFLGVGTRKVAVAWTTLRFTDAGPVLDMTADALRVTPEYRAGEPVVVVGTQTAKQPQATPETPASATPPER